MYRGWRVSWRQNEEREFMLTLMRNRLKCEVECTSLWSWHVVPACGLCMCACIIAARTHACSWFHFGSYCCILKLSTVLLSRCTRRNLFTKQIITRNYRCFSICFQKNNTKAQTRSDTQQGRNCISVKERGIYQLILFPIKQIFKATILFIFFF